MSGDMGKAQGEKENRPEPMAPSGGRTVGTSASSQSMMQLLQSEETFPVTLAILTGAVAALIIMVAGLHAERQSEVIIERAMIGFLVSGLVMFFACRWLNDRGIPLYVSRHEEMQHNWVSEPETEGVVQAQAVPNEKTPGDEAPDLTENAFAPSPLVSEFSPLESSLPHVEVPKG